MLGLAMADSSASQASLIISLLAGVLHCCLQLRLHGANIVSPGNRREHSEVDGLKPAVASSLLPGVGT